MSVFGVMVKVLERSKLLVESILGSGPAVNQNMVRELNLLNYLFQNIFDVKEYLQNFKFRNLVQFLFIVSLGDTRLVANLN